jgi:glutaredoxin
VQLGAALALAVELASGVSLVGGTGAIGCALGLSACHKPGNGEPDKKSDDLPSLRISDQTQNLMLTWIDGHGGTHVEVSPNRVPDEGRKLVRVIVTGREEGTGDPIYVTDLTKRDGDGSYATRPMARQEWENEIERRRGAVASLPESEGHGHDGSGRDGSGHDGDPHGHGPGTPPADRPPADPHDPGPDPADPGGDAYKNLKVIVYGASWCGPCHMAQDHLRRKHVPFVFKDVDQDHDAQVEMSAKLAKAGGRSGSIPVIDVGGRIMVGYDARALDQALDRAGGGTAL